MRSRDRAAEQLGYRRSGSDRHQYAAANGYDACVQIDGDGQHPAGEVVKLVGAWQEHHCDIVVGSRYLDADSFMSTRVRRAGSRLVAGTLQLFFKIKSGSAYEPWRRCVPGRQPSWGHRAGTGSAAVILDPVSGLAFLMLVVATTLPLFARQFDEVPVELLLVLGVVSPGSLVAMVTLGWGASRIRVTLRKEDYWARLIEFFADIWKFRRLDSLLRQFWTSAAVHCPAGAGDRRPP